MSTDRSKPYIEGKPGDLLTASMWNAAQIEAKKDIASEIVSLEARMKDSLVAGATELKTASLSADSLSAGKGTVSALKVGDLEVTGKMSGSVSLGVKRYAAHARYGEGSFYGNNGWTWYNNDQYLGPQMYNATSYSTGQWGWGGPALSFTLGATSLVQLTGSWTWWIYSSGGQYHRWAQFIVGSGGKWAPVSTHSAPYGGEQNVVSGYSYNRPSPPNASNWATWLDYHQTFYNSYNRWPMAGVVTLQSYNSYNNNNWGHTVVQHTESVELPAGSYTIYMGFSGQYLTVGNLQLQALVFPGGSNG